MVDETVRGWAGERESTCKQCPRSQGNPLLRAAVFPLKIAHQAVDRLGAACGNGWTGWTGWTGGQTVCAAGETYMASSVDRPQAVLAGGSVTVSARVSACREQGADGPNSGECAGTGASRCGSDMSGSSCAPTPYSTQALSPPRGPDSRGLFRQADRRPHKRWPCQWRPVAGTLPHTERHTDIMQPLPSLARRGAGAPFDGGGGRLRQAHTRARFVIHQCSNSQRAEQAKTASRPANRQAGTPSRHAKQSKASEQAGGQHIRLFAHPPIRPSTLPPVRLVDEPN